MKTQVHPVPEGHRTIAPYLVVRNASRAIEFYRKAFNAEELVHLKDSDARTMHAEIQIGDSLIMLTDERPETQALSPESLGGTPVSIHLYAEDVDALFNQAIDFGATVVTPIKDQFYGDRSGSLRDPFGHLWHVATHQEDVALDELQFRLEGICHTL